LESDIDAFQEFYESRRASKTSSLLNSWAQCHG
jgi:hypothetical protein